MEGNLSITTGRQCLLVLAVSRAVALYHRMGFVTLNSIPFANFFCAVITSSLPLPPISCRIQKIADRMHALETAPNEFQTRSGDEPPCANQLATAAKAFGLQSIWSR